MKRSYFLILAVMLIAFSFSLSACQKVDFQIEFIVDGKTYATINTNGNETIKMPANPTKTGYSFDGWYWDKDSWKKPFTANSLLNEPLTESLQVYAKWNDGTAPVGTQARFEGFTQVNAETFSIKVPSATSSFFLGDKVTANPKSQWTLSTDIFGNDAVASKTALLPNRATTYLYYALVTADDGSIKQHTLQIRRKAVFTVSFNIDGGSPVASQTVPQGRQTVCRQSACVDLHERQILFGMLLG
ncbi:MAG: InlB B-repeat-containing protein [Firmicutes bacterium]|nr:InlB B-repeat-containing protein [Bacillota bacterium]